MRSLAAFNILFDNPHATYYSGQHVTGHIFIRLVREKRLGGIELRFSGVAQIHWTVDREEKDANQKKYTVTDHYWSREAYFENNFFAIGGPSGEMTLPPGEHYYPFRLILPQMIPSSYESELGHVRYTCRGVILRPWRFQHECKVAFTVLNPLDLNFEPNLQNPAQYTKEKYLCCCCCRSGPISLVVSLESQGFVPGQKVQGVIEVDNITNEEVSVKCDLIQNVTFTGSCHSSVQSKVLTNVVAQYRVGRVVKRGSITTPLDMQIPALPASYLRNCNSIDISYSLEIKGAISGAHSNMSVGVPIVIGTIPLRTHMPALAPPAEQAPPRANYPSAAMAVGSQKEMEPSAPPDPFASYPELPPPTYEESTSWKANIRSVEDNEFVEGSMEFAPRYPIYNFS